MDDTSDMNKPNKARGPRSAEDRVKGLLVMLPWLVQERRAVPLTEMAEHFGMSVQHLVKDLELATLCGRPPYTPDQYIELIIDEDTVFASMPRFIENAPALTIAEGLAVLTALKSVQLIPGGASAVATNSLMAKLETVLAPHMEAIDVVITEPEHLATMNSACDAKESVEIVYFVPSRAELTEREITPEQIFNDHDHWYVRGFDSKTKSERTFRIDRIEEARRTGKRGKLLKSLAAAGKFFTSGNESLTLVTLDINASDSWMLDNYPTESVEKNQDGSIRVTLFATSEHWLGRLLVRLGPDTKVVSPRKWQKLRESTSSSILARYTS